MRMAMKISLSPQRYWACLFWYWSGLPGKQNLQPRQIINHATEFRKTGPEAEYQALMQAGELKPDDDQAKAVVALEQLYRALIEYPAIGHKRDGFALKSWFPAGIFRWPASDKPAPKGIYLYGGVGRGKSMLMDLFYSVSPIASKRRVHFHEFMLDIHARQGMA